MGEMKTKGALKPALPYSSVFKRFGLDGIRHFVVQIKSFMALGLQDWEIAEQIGLNFQEYNEVKKELYRWETADLYDRPTEQHYIDYVVKQEGCIRELNNLIQECTGGTKDKAVRLGAVRAKSEIFDKIIKFGQDMNILEKAPERKQFVAGVVVTQLSNEDLKEAIEKELKQIHALANRYSKPKELKAPDQDDELPIRDNVIEADFEESEKEHSEISPPVIQKKKRGRKKKLKDEPSPEEEDKGEEISDDVLAGVVKPEFNEDLKPFFSRNPASRAKAAKVSRLRSRLSGRKKDKES